MMRRVIQTGFVLAILAGSPLQAQMPSPDAGRSIEANRAAKLAHDAEALIAAARYDDAIDAERQALALRAQFLGAEHPDTLRSIAALALIHERQSRPIEARLLFSYAATVGTRILGPGDPNAVTARRALAGLVPPGAAAPRAPTPVEAEEIAHLVAAIAETFRADQGRTSQEYGAAEPTVQRLIALRAALLGPDHPETLLALLDLVRLHRYLQEYVEAEIIARHVLDVRKRTLGPGNALTIQAAGTVLQSVQYNTPDYEQRHRALRETTLADAERVLGPSHPNLVPILGWMVRAALASSSNVELAVRLELRRLGIVDRQPQPDLNIVYEITSDLSFRLRNLKRFEEAERYGLRTIAVAQKLYGADSWQVRSALQALAGVYTAAHRGAEAVQMAQRAVDSAVRAQGAAGEDTVKARSFLDVILREAGQMVPPSRLAQQAQPARSHDDLVEDAATQVMAAQTSYEAGRYAAAEPLARDAVQRLVELTGPDDPVTLGATTILAKVCLSQGKLAEAEQLSRHLAETWSRKVGPTGVEAVAAGNNLANVYMAQGRYGEAQPLYERVLQGQGAAGTAPVSLLLNLAALYRAQRRDAEAEPLIRAAMERSQLGRGRDDLDTIRAVTDLAALLRDRAAYPDARALAERALASHDTAHRPDHPARFAAMALLASIDVRQRRIAAAEALYRQALAGRERVLGAGHPATLQSLYDLAALDAESGRPAEAEALARRAFEARLTVLGRANPDTLASAEQLTVLALERPGAGAPDIAVARLLVEETRVRRDHAGASLWARAQDAREAATASVRFAVFADAAWSARASNPVVLRDEAFRALQDAVVGAADRSIAEATARRYADGRAAGLANLIRKRQDLQAHWSNFDAFLSRHQGLETAQDSQLIAEVRGEMTELQSLIGETDALLQTAAPDYFSLARPTPLTVAETQALLGPDEAVLLVVPSRFGTHVVAVTHDGAAWNRSAWTATHIRTVVQELRWDASYELGGSPAEFADTRLFPRRDRPAYRRSLAFELYQQLIAPVAGTLAGKRQVYVAAGGALAALPFSILVSAAPLGTDDDPAALRGTHWFGDDVALVHIPSIQSLALLRRSDRGHRSNPGFMGIGNPVLAPVPRSAAQAQAAGAPAAAAVVGAARLFTSNPTRSVGELASPAALRALPSLPGTAAELERVRVALGAPATSLMMAQDATEPRVRAADYSQVGVLLFSTHGAMVEESGSIGEAGLVLTPPSGDATEGNDGYLAASEVAALRLNADWVILSACNTATGDGTDNPGLGQLARAFFYAGARNLLASHWPVADDVAPILITDTLARERRGVARAEAFRQATRAIRLNADHDSTGTWAHPFYWAPFVLIGDGASPAVR